MNPQRRCETEKLVLWRYPIAEMWREIRRDEEKGNVGAGKWVMAMAGAELRPEMQQQHKEQSSEHRGYEYKQ